MHRDNFSFILYFNLDLQNVLCFYVHDFYRMAGISVDNNTFFNNEYNNIMSSTIILYIRLMHTFHTGD